MQRLPSRGSKSRPQTLQTTISYTADEVSSSVPTARARANTVHEATPVSESTAPYKVNASLTKYGDDNDDIFESQVNDASSDHIEASGLGVFPDGFEELPPEIQTLMENFLESLGAKVHSTPLSIDRLSELFQDFYQHANQQIDSHIALLASRFPSGQSRSPSTSSNGSLPTKASAKKVTKTSVKNNARQDPFSAYQQMLTPSEIADRRKARRHLELKRIKLEEAVERGICERVYNRIWRHRSTDDEERDEKLRSRAAALALVGVDLRELLSTAMNDDSKSMRETSLVKEEDEVSAHTRLTNARHSLKLMNDEKYPLGKLDHLTAAHKSIVESLQQMMPSTSSADEVLPALIYSIITSDPNTNHVVSNFNFIQRFRASDKIDGEAAYCLTNFEAAITFLETVDLSSIRADEVPEGPGRNNSQPPTPRTDTPDPMYHALPSHAEPTKAEESRVSQRQIDSPSVVIIRPMRPARLSLLNQNRPKAFEAQSDAVLKAADEAFDTIHSALDGSFKFLFGRLRERQATSLPNTNSDLIVPRTLEDARKLVSSPVPADDDMSIADSSIADQAEDTPMDPLGVEKPDEQRNSNGVLKMIGGRRPRQLSIDSNTTGGKKPPLAEKSSTTNSTKSKTNPKSDEICRTSTTVAISSTPTFANSTVPSTAFAAVESMRNFGNTLNPLRGFAGMGMMRGFSRSASSPINTPSSTTANLPSPLDQEGAAVAGVEQEKEVRKDALDLNGVAPPMQRFVECRDARDLNGFETELLLRDYQRLAGLLRALREGQSEAHN